MYSHPRAIAFVIFVVSTLSCVPLAKQQESTLKEDYPEKCPTHGEKLVEGQQLLFEGSISRADWPTLDHYLRLPYSGYPLTRDRARKGTDGQYIIVGVCPVCRREMEKIMALGGMK
ncbi:MAG: hypothetical protein JNL58_17970 [Planctomyces sp.]|nr:hypothetical protein [Planctomyces sp.]